MWFYWSRLQLAFYFGELDLAEKMIEPAILFSSIDNSYIINSIRIFFSGLTLSLLARRTGNQRYRTRAKNVCREMETVMKQRGLNNLHRYLLMKATFSTCDVKASRQPGAVKEAFERAISAASRAGFLQDAALGNELAGEYFLSAGDDFWTKHYLNQAYKLYIEWGAKAKARNLRKKHRIHIERSSKFFGRHLSNLDQLVSSDASDIHKQVNFDMLKEAEERSVGPNKSDGNSA